MFENLRDKAGEALQRIDEFNSTGSPIRKVGLLIAGLALTGAVGRTIVHVGEALQGNPPQNLSDISKLGFIAVLGLISASQIQKYERLKGEIDKNNANKDK